MSRSACEVCGETYDYCGECGTCHKCMGEDVDRLKAELEEAQADIKGVMHDYQKVSAERLPLWDEIEDLERQLAEAKVENDRLFLENRQMLQGMKWDNQIRAEARQEAAREIIQYIEDQGMIDAGTVARPMLVYEIAKCDLEELRKRFGLEG